MLTALKWGTGYVVVWLISIPVTGLLISATWDWFVSPIIGIREISLSEGVGLSLFIGVAGYAATVHLQKFTIEGETDPSKIAWKGLTKFIGAAIFGPLLSLVIAWFWHTFFVSPPSF